MKKHLSFAIVAIVLLLFSNTSFGQTPNGTINLGVLESFEGFTGAGAVTNGGTWTGDAGTNIGGFGGFAAGPPTFTGNTFAANASTAQARFDLFRLYIHLNALYVNYPDTHPAAFGDGETLSPGVYSRSAAASIGTILNLDANNDPNAFFVIKCAGALTIGAGAEIKLLRGARSCNVFIIADGSIDAAAGGIIKGTLFAKIGAVGLGAGVDLEGRMFAIQGALVAGVACVVRPPADACTIPIFCETGCNPAPAVDVLGSLANYALYTNLGVVSNTSITGIDGNIGADSGSTTGFGSSIIVGDFHVADASTTQAKTDIGSAFTALMALPTTVPNPSALPPVPAHATVFGRVVSLGDPGETVFPGVYDIVGAGSLLNTLILDGQGDPNAIFVFRFTSTLSVGAAAISILINGAKRCNVFWIAGAGVGTAAIDIGAGAALQGTFLSHGGAVGTGASTFLAGRQLSTGGAITTYGGIIYNNPKCVTSKTLKTTAITDSPSVLAGATTPSVVANDISKGLQAVIGTAAGQVILTFTNTAQLTMNTDGTITVAANALPGSYSITYTICEVSNPTICSTVTSTVTVTEAIVVNEAGTITADQSICKDSTPNDLTLTGNTGNVIKWQKSTDLLFTTPIDIALSASTTLSGATIGALAETTYLRAVVQNGTAPIQYSNVVTITVPSTTWNGTSWNNGVPTITTTAFITGNYSESTYLVACTLTISSNAVVEIPSGTNVRLNGKLTVEPGSKFTLNNNCNLIQQTDAVNTGNITVKRDSSPMYKFDYTLWSSPVSGTQKLSNFSPLTSNSGPSNIRFYTYNTLTNLYNNTNPRTTNFDAAKSYLIRAPYNWGPWSTLLNPVAVSWTGSFTGVPRNGSVPFTMVNTGEATSYNATGNPYPSAISLVSFLADNINNIEGTLWFWRKYNDSTNETSYSTCTTLGCVINNNATYVYDQFISVGQGFIVKAKTGQTTLNFTNSMRSGINVNQFFKMSSTQTDRFWLKMTNATNGIAGQNLIAYTPNATTQYDSGLDGLYNNDSPVAFYSKAAKQEVVINARPSFELTDVVPLIMKTDVADTYTFSLNQKEGIFNGKQDVLLRDNYTNKTQNLSQADYSFTSAIGSFTDRFEIIYQNNLGVNSSEFNSNKVIISNKDHLVQINSGNSIMSSLKIFDIQGRLLLSKSSINDTKTSLKLNFNNQVLLFHITAQDGNTVIKKVIN